MKTKNILSKATKTDHGAVQAITLVANQQYDETQLRHLGWTDGDGSGTNGYDCWAYFADGRYLGPDAHGIEPIFTIAGN